MKNYIKKTISISFIILISLSTQTFARDYIEIVGSSTVFPFSSVVAENFGKKTGKPTPKIESTGTGGGMKLFCKGIGVKTPDITNASRRIKLSEYNNCMKNGVTDVTEVLIGFDGIAIANSFDGPTFNLTLREMYLALATKIPAQAYDKNTKNNNLIDNPFTHWNQINAKLPNVKIKVLGPPPTSGTRDALQELAIEGGCKTYDFMAKLKSSNKSKYKALCRNIREDGHYIEVGENDNLIISKLEKDVNAVGIFGYSFLEQNSEKVKGANINNVEISFENIANGDYPISRPLYFYIKNAHRDVVDNLDEFLNYFVEEDNIGDFGYLTEKGLIPTNENTRNNFVRDVAISKKLKM